MKSKWKVTSNNIGGKTMYAAYRMVDVNGIDHSGNREFATGYLTVRAEAEAVADRLNAEEDDLCRAKC